MKSLSHLAIKSAIIMVLLVLSGCSESPDPDESLPPATVSTSKTATKNNTDSAPVASTAADITCFKGGECVWRAKNVLEFMTAVKKCQTLGKTTVEWAPTNDIVLTLASPKEGVCLLKAYNEVGGTLHVPNQCILTAEEIAAMTTEQAFDVYREVARTGQVSQSVVFYVQPINQCVEGITGSVLLKISH